MKAKKSLIFSILTFHYNLLLSHILLKTSLVVPTKLNCQI